MASAKPDESFPKKQFLWCNYHRDHGHKTDRCRSLNFLMENLIKAGHLRRYIRKIDHRGGSRQAANRVAAGAAVLSESRPAINYILGPPSDDQY